MYVFDSFAWLELFDGTPRGQHVKKILDQGGHEITTTSANYYEVFYRIEQKLGPIIRDQHMHYITNNSRIIPIDREIAEVAAQLRLTDRLSAIDAFTLAAARISKGKVVTGDKDFQKFKNEVILI